MSRVLLLPARARHAQGTRRGKMQRKRNFITLLSNAAECWNMRAHCGDLLRLYLLQFPLNRLVYIDQTQKTFQTVLDILEASKSIREHTTAFQ
jgi:hypothetical protein